MNRRLPFALSKGGKRPLLRLAMFAGVSILPALSLGLVGPTNTLAPVISGTPTRGELLVTTDGTWTGLPALTYQWTADGTNISGATAAGYVLVVGDVGKLIRCRVTATNAGGSASATSNSLGPVAALAAPTKLTDPVIVGTGAGGTANPQDIEGTALTATPGTYTGTAVAVTGQWQRDAVDISGETNLTYATTSADVGAVIRYRETATNAAGSVGPTASNTFTIKNGILTAFGFRDTSTTTLARATYFKNTDYPGTVNRAPAAGPTPTGGTYNISVTGSVTSGGNDPTYGANLIGVYVISGSGGRVNTKGLPLNVPLNIRIALGVGINGTTTTGAAFYDGDPDTVGVKLFEIGGTPGVNQVIDASGAILAANLWDATNLPHVVTLTTGRTGGLGEIWIARNAAANPIDWRFFEVDYAAYGIEKAGVGPYFVKPGGSNLKDGKSLANAWANMPGDPDAAGGAVASFVLLPDAVVNVEGGVHKPASFTGRTTWLRQMGAGTSGHPIVIQPRSGSGEVIFDGSEDFAFATAATGLTFGNPNEASITTEILSVASTGMIKAPVQNGVPLRPCTRPKASDISAYDFSDSGNDAFWAEDYVSGPYGSAPVFTVGAADSGGAGFRKVTYSGTRILSAYGSVSIQNYPVYVRMNGNQIVPQIVLTHNTVTGAFTFNIGNGEDLINTSSGFADFYWQIRYHPFDILEQGQYGYDLTLTKPMGWFAAGGTRGIIRLDRFMTAAYGDWQFNGGSDLMQVRNLMGNDAYVCENPSTALASRVVFSKFKTRGTASVSRNYLFQQAGGGTAWSWTDLDIADNFTSGGISILKGFSAVGLRIKLRECGRTGIYVAGPSPNQSTDCTFTDIDMSDWSGVHANGGSVYEDAQRITFTKYSSIDHVRPLTSQGRINDFTRTNEISYYLAIGRIQPSGAPRIVSHATQANDNNATASYWHHGIVAEGDLGMLVGPNSVGHRVENIYASSFNTTSSAYIAGIKFANCLFGPGSSYGSLAAMIAAGADPTSYNVVFTGTAWDGTITAAARQKLTANANLGTYSDVTLGCTGQSWFVPAYGTSFALADCNLSSLTARKGHQAGKPFTQIINTSPESVLSLPGGVSGSNNSLFSLIRGKVVFITAPTDPVGTTYNLDVLQTNASADRTGSSTKTTRFVITLT